ncbi:MAG: ThuA domain-containing protein, partial [Candidatus Sulfotelmatobacter sp.]
MRHTRIALFFFFLPLILRGFASAQDQPAVDPSVAPPPHAKQIHLKHILVIGQTKGYEHDSVSNAMAAIYNM